jgi:hypothetical protein
MVGKKSLKSRKTLFYLSHFLQIIWRYGFFFLSLPLKWEKNALAEKALCFILAKYCQRVE